MYDTFFSDGGGLPTLTKESALNYLIKESKADTNKISDGYHTFEQLYEHRIVLWMAVCRLWDRDNGNVWTSLKHSDGSNFEGWFLLGITKGNGEQITYHLPVKYWDEVCQFSDVLEQAPEFDGHTSEDVLKRIKNL